MGDLTADINYSGGDPECYIRIYNGEYENEKNSVDSIWEIEIQSISHRGADLVINNSQQEKGFI